jgi:hypothetical protein
MAALSYACHLWSSRFRFSIVQLQGLEAHVISQTGQEGKSAPSCPVRLMPPASDQSPSAFLFVQLQRLEARDISHAIQKGKVRLYGCPVLCLSPLTKPLPLFYSYT